MSKKTFKRFMEIKHSEFVKWASSSGWNARVKTAQRKAAEESPEESKKPMKKKKSFNRRIV